MHELAITRSVVEMVLERTGGRRHIASVQIRVGALSGVLADAMRFCFDVSSAGTALEGAELEIEEIPGRASCRTCGRDFEVNDLVLLCPCGCADVRVIAGRELLVTSVRMGSSTCA